MDSEPDFCQNKLLNTFSIVPKTLIEKPTYFVTAGQSRVAAHAVADAHAALSGGPGRAGAEARARVNDQDQTARGKTITRTSYSYARVRYIFHFDKTMHLLMTSDVNPH